MNQTNLFIEDFVKFMTEVGNNIAIVFKYGVSSDNAIKISKIKKDIFLNEAAKKIAIKSIVTEENLNRQAKTGEESE